MLFPLTREMRSLTHSGVKGFIQSHIARRWCSSCGAIGVWVGAFLCFLGLLINERRISVLFLFFFFFLLWLPLSVLEFQGQGSDLSHSCYLSSYGNAGSLNPLCRAGAGGANLSPGAEMPHWKLQHLCSLDTPRRHQLPYVQTPPNTWSSHAGCDLKINALERLHPSHMPFRK